MQPTGEHESHWEKLGCLLAQEESPETSIRRLQARYPDPVPVLCILLDEKVARDEEYRDIERYHQRAVEILLVLGTRESLNYLLARMALLSWDDPDLLCELIEVHAALFSDLATSAWPRLDWVDRSHLLEIYVACDLDVEPLLTLLFAVDTDAIGYDDLGRYVDMLGCFDEPRAAPRIRQLIVRALNDLERQPTEKARRFARSAGYVLLEEQDEPIDPELRKRAAELHIRWRI